jgi:hypothetical protein
MGSKHVAAYSDEEIDKLIQCPKSVREHPRRELKLCGAYWRNDMTLNSSDPDRKFAVFMRKNEDLPENFSIGLNFLPNDLRGDIVLVRCSGPHGTFTEGIDFNPLSHHWDFHIHRASEAAMNAGFRADKFAARTDAFETYDGALQYFLRLINLSVEDTDRFFPNRPSFLPGMGGDDYGTS